MYKIKRRAVSYRGIFPLSTRRREFTPKKKREFLKVSHELFRSWVMVEASQWRCISDGDDPSRNAVNGETYQLTCGWTLQQQADVRSRLANGRRCRQGRGGGCAIKVDEKQHMQNQWAFVFYPFLLLYSVRDSPTAYEERERVSAWEMREIVILVDNEVTTRRKWPKTTTRSKQWDTTKVCWNWGER